MSSAFLGAGPAKLSAKEITFYHQALLYSLNKPPVVYVPLYFKREPLFSLKSYKIENMTHT